MKRRNRKAAFSMILAAEAILLVLICVGFAFVATNSSGSLPTSTTSTPTEIIPPTDTPTLVTPDAPVQEFNLSNANQTIPDDILEEIAYFPALGGEKSDCYDGFIGGVNDVPLDFKELTIPSIPNQKFELMNVIKAEVCGVIPGETLKTRIIYPDGSDKVFQNLVEKYRFIFYYQLASNDPPGTYTVIIEGQKGKVVFQPVVIKPSGPRLVHIEDQWFFYNFSPKENIRVVAFKSTPASSGVMFDMVYTPIYWQEYRADQNGKLLVKSNEEFLAGIGEFAGQVTDGSFPGATFCPKPAQELDIQSGEWVMVMDNRSWILNEGDWQKIYLPKGTVFRVTGYIEGRDSFFMGYRGYFNDNLCNKRGKQNIKYLGIYCDSGIKFCTEHSMIPESVGNRYFVRSISRPNSDVLPACADAPAPHLKIGKYATVVSLGILASSLYDDATETILSMGTKVKVIAGPVCHMSQYNWFVQPDNIGLEGWVSEGYTSSGNVSYQLEPLP